MFILDTAASCIIYFLVFFFSFLLVHQIGYLFLVRVNWGETGG